MVGIPVLAQKLVQIQAASISKRLPEMVKKINEKLNANLSELQTLPKSMTSAADAMTAFMRIIGLAKESLRKILLTGEFDEYPDEKKMHCTARIVEMLDNYSDQLHQCPESDPCKNFLVEEISVLEESKLYNIKHLVNKDLEVEIVNELLGPQGFCIERLLEESPSVAVKREKVRRSITKLREAMDVLCNVTDKVTVSLCEIA
ncbi:Dynamin-related protein 4C [Quillaja saponaria]|uniref:Dynamin-related protein 4C n=1 Tax=Quillaja saponaria TaxID=32244 RepID=A0AAD7M345_QUISA|nr:Dynamin-related protein 4C [Quillaja saponaria]